MWILIAVAVIAVFVAVIAIMRSAGGADRHAARKDFIIRQPKS